ncbi:MAG: triose-phosphate isomerase [Sediminibacterium sp.]|nr:triose-phosphate isomerase [Sediminibacterium sp.]
MRKQYAAANWKMNLTLTEGEDLIKSILASTSNVAAHQKIIFAVPFPLLIPMMNLVQGFENITIAAQNCHQKLHGAFTGEISTKLIASLGIKYVILGHSERRQFFAETNELLKEKVDIALSQNLTPIFCCGEPLSIRNSNQQNEFVSNQIEASLFHLNTTQISNIVFAYEPIWAIGTGQTATSDQAQEMHQFIRETIASKYNQETAQQISILYGGSVKADNAKELFSRVDVDGGLVGGASLISKDFSQIIAALK